MEQLRQSWYLYWDSDEKITSLVVHDKTLDEALACASEFGYCEPKWWQFWRHKIRVYNWE